MPHAIEMKDGKILTPFGIRDLLEAVSDYAGEELAREIESYIDTNATPTRSPSPGWTASPTRPSSTPMRGLPENASGFSMSRTAPRCTAASA